MVPMHNKCMQLLKKDQSRHLSREAKSPAAVLGGFGGPNKWALLLPAGGLLPAAVLMTDSDGKSAYVLASGSVKR